MKCRDCGHTLNHTTVFENLKALQDAYIHLCFTGPMLAGCCPNGCRSTFSDLNLNARMVFVDVDSREEFTSFSELPLVREEIA
jgi:hypothetical protein